jgi:predicted branched-subunit amino acid permease
MTPHLAKPFWKRALDSHLMIDESVAVGTAAQEPENALFGYRWGGLAVFVSWNITTLIGAILGSQSGDLITKYGIDAAIPASFLALVWPRLQDREQLPIALLGALICLVLTPVLPAGLPIVASAIAALLALRSLPTRPDGQHA